ncbi:alpha/beta fold hydrolase [Tenacibaculum amylolyticum]|uniref:alpha/beta fold hydrolase n=1 Tax=Tenacibaculum amylolyticum TaxID=104269 RepID=UPI0038939050
MKQVKLKKISLYIILLLLIVISTLYIIPVQKKEFSELYNDNSEIQASLLHFREYPKTKLKIEGIDWEYLSIGNGKRYLLFLHGMGGAYDIWWQQIEHLKKDFNIISITLPEIHSLTEVTNGIVTILNKEKIDTVTVIGSSMGGYIAQYFMSTYPNKIYKVVLGNTFPPNDIFKTKNAKLRKLVPFFPEWLVMSKFKENVTTTVIPASENSKLVEAYLIEQYSGLMSKNQFIGRFDIVLEYFDVQRNTIDKTIPILIIESENDPLVPVTLREKLKSTYPEATVFSFKDKGHFPYLNRPKEYNSILYNFLNSTLQTKQEKE